MHFVTKEEKSLEFIETRVSYAPLGKHAYVSICQPPSQFHIRDNLCDLRHVQGNQPIRRVPVIKCTNQKAGLCSFILLMSSWLRDFIHSSVVYICVCTHYYNHLINGYMTENGPMELCLFNGWTLPCFLDYNFCKQWEYTMISWDLYMYDVTHFTFYSLQFVSAKELDMPMLDSSGYRS